jgi:hypothetical protein
VSALVLSSCQNTPVGVSANIDNSPQAPSLLLNAALPLVSTASNAFESTEINTASVKPVVSASDAKTLKRTDAIIEHTFSDGSKLRFRNIAGHAMENSDVAIADTDKLPRAF